MSVFIAVIKNNAAGRFMVSLRNLNPAYKAGFTDNSPPLESLGRNQN